MAAPVSNDLLPRPGHAGSGDDTASRHGALRVVLLEDDDIDADVIARQLTRAWPSGVEIRRATRLSELEAALVDRAADPAVDAAADPVADIVLRDLSVPDGHGIDLLERAVAAAGPIPLIVLTAADTAMAAKALERGAQDYLAAIANEHSANRYGLEILRRDIESQHQNFTRFLVLSTIMVQSQEHNKASLSLVLDHHPGSLADVLDIFREHRINLTKVQTFPVLDNPMEYMVQIDIEFHKKEDYERAISQALKSVSGISILGEYKRANLPAENP